MTVTGPYAILIPVSTAREYGPAWTAPQMCLQLGLQVNSIGMTKGKPIPGQATELGSRVARAFAGTDLDGHYLVEMELETAAVLQRSADGDGHLGPVADVAEWIETFTVTLHPKEGAWLDVDDALMRGIRDWLSEAIDVPVTIGKAAVGAEVVEVAP